MQKIQIKFVNHRKFGKKLYCEKGGNTCKIFYVKHKSYDETNEIVANVKQI